MLIKHVYEQSLLEKCVGSCQQPQTKEHCGQTKRRALPQRSISDTRVCADIISLIRRRTGQEVKCEGQLDNLSQQIQFLIHFPFCSSLFHRVVRRSSFYSLFITCYVTPTLPLYPSISLSPVSSLLLHLLSAPSHPFILLILHYSLVSFICNMYLFVQVCS